MTGGGAELAARLGRVGVWTRVPAPEEDQRLAATIEGLGFGAWWIGGSPGPDELARIELAIGRTRSLVLATGIVNVWAWRPEDLAAAAGRLEERHPGRFVLGLGISHAPVVRAMGLDFTRPLATMAGYLDALDSAAASLAAPTPPRVLAALRPGMLRLAASRSAGAHPYVVPPEHTERARALLGADAFLAPEAAVVLDGDPGAARERARSALSGVLSLENYVENLRALGFGPDDLAGGGSDRLVDALVGWGDEARVAAHLRRHLDAGADHVAVQVLLPTGQGLPEVLARLAPVLHEL